MGDKREFEENLRKKYFFRHFYSRETWKTQLRAHINGWQRNRDPMKRPKKESSIAWQHAAKKQSISPLRRSFHLCHFSFHTVIWPLTLSKTSETGRDWWMRRKFENCSAGLKFSMRNQLNFILEFLSFGHPFRLDFSNLWDLSFLFLFSYDALCLMVNMRNNTTFLSSLLHFWIIGFHDFSL